MIDLTQAATFLDALGGDDFIFQTFTDNKDKIKNKEYDPLAKVLIGTFEQHQEKLAQLSKKGAGIFVQINFSPERGKDLITDIRAVWVDLDNPATAKESLAAIKKYMPRPTIITQSSKGKYHIYWRVTDCAVDQFSRFQQSLAIKFYSDISMKNLDRVMRIPGFPHQKSTPQPVSFVCPGGEYTLAEIHKAAAKAPNITPTVREPEEKKSKDAFGLDIGDGHEIPTVLAPGDRTQKMVGHIGYLANQGFSAEHIRKEIVRMNVELCPKDATPMAPNLLNQEVLGCVEKFTDKLAEERKQHSIDHPKVPEPKPEAPDCPDVEYKDPIDAEEGNTLEKWLDRFWWVEQGGRVLDSSREGTYAEHAWKDFKLSKANVFIGSKTLLSNAWIKCKERKTVRDTIYNPTQKQIITKNKDQFWNLYSPSAIKPAEKFDETKIAEFVLHMEFFFPQKVVRERFMDWMAMTIQKQEIRIPWAPLIISNPGAGKGFIYNVLTRLLGSHNCSVILQDRIDMPFNSFLSESVLVCLDELDFSQKKFSSSKLRSYITDPIIEINRKNIGEGSQEIFANFIMFANGSVAAQIEADDRRFWVIKVKGTRPASYYTNIWNWNDDDENIGHLLRFLLDRDLSDFNYAEAPPMTRAKQEMINAGKSEIAIELEDAITGRTGPFAADIVGYTVVKEYIADRCNLVIKGSVEGRLRQTYGKLTHLLKKFTEPMTTVIEGNPMRQRVRCVRNPEFWAKQSAEDVRYELTRCVQLATGNGNVLPPKLEVVEK